jgi:UDP-glucose 4-epimerase
MRVVVIGASGNVGTSVLEALEAESTVKRIVGIARRRPPEPHPLKVEWVEADVGAEPIAPHLEGADAVVHLAWAIQPSRDRAKLRRINVDGSRRVFDAVAEAGVPVLLYASSIGAYSPGRDQRHPVDETWPTGGVPTSFYSVDKAAVERLLDDFEADNPNTRVVRFRPALIMKRSAGSEVRRLFAGPMLPSPLVRPDRLKVVPWILGMRTQVVHSLDVGEAFRLALVGDVSGAFNLAAEPVIDADSVGEILGARVLPVPARLARIGAWASWKAHLQPSPEGWVDMGTQVPLLDTTRAREELGWYPTRSAGTALKEVLAGMAEGAGERTPPLAPDPDAEEGGRVDELIRGAPER